jgi:hypothetical protein
MDLRRGYPAGARADSALTLSVPSVAAPPQGGAVRRFRSLTACQGRLIAAQRLYTACVGWMAVGAAGDDRDVQPRDESAATPASDDSRTAEYRAHTDSPSGYERIWR